MVSLVVVQSTVQGSDQRSPQVTEPYFASAPVSRAALHGQGQNKT
jgi:hypothetical protein